MNLRRSLALSGLCFALSAAAFSAALPGQWHAWHYSRAIESARPGVLNYIPAGPEILSHSESGTPDLRILDESGAELPYVVRTSIGVEKRDSWPVTVRENSFVPGQYTQVVLDLGVYPRFHNAVRVETTETDFITWVEVAASDDARIWRIVKPRAPISRFRKEGLEGNQTIHYSENNARYLRLQIKEGTAQFPITGAAVLPSSISQKDIIPAQWITLQASRAPDQSSPAGQTEWTLDLGSGLFPLNAVDFVADQPEFYRAVRISTSLDGKEWNFSGGGEIYRYMEENRREESLRVPVSNFSGSRYWRIQVLNGNDVPLANAKLSLAMVPRLILFRPASGHTYRIAYGNEKAESPRYDLERTLRISATEEAFADTIGAEEENDGFQDPRPFTERHPALLWVALAIAAALVGYTALRTLRTPPAPQE